MFLFVGFHIHAYLSMFNKTGMEVSALIMSTENEAFHDRLDVYHESRRHTRSY